MYYYGRFDASSHSSLAPYVCVCVASHLCRETVMRIQRHAYSWQMQTSCDRWLILCILIRLQCTVPMVYEVDGRDYRNLQCDCNQHMHWRLAFWMWMTYIECEKKMSLKFDRRVRIGHCGFWVDWFRIWCSIQVSISTKIGAKSKNRWFYDQKKNRLPKRKELVKCKLYSKMILGSLHCSSML